MHLAVTQKLVSLFLPSSASEVPTLVDTLGKVAGVCRAGDSPFKKIYFFLINLFPKRR